MQHTQNYQLSRWEKDDRIMMEDFNADNAKLDAALAAKADAEDVTALAETVAALTAGLGSGGQNARIAWGTYTGNGTYGSSNARSLTFDFYPMLIVCGSDWFVSSGCSPTVFLRGRAKACSECGCYPINVTWSDTGITWYNDQSDDYMDNEANVAYSYVAIGCDNAAANN